MFAKDIPKAPRKQCSNASDITPILARLAELTGHPEIIDQPQSYARSAQRWATGIPGELEPEECRDDSEVKFIQTLCHENVCGKYNDGFCKIRCGTGMNIEVKSTMVTESCPWIWCRW